MKDETKIGLPTNTARNLSLISTTIVLTSILVLTAFNSYAESAGHGAHWGYSGDIGPGHWGQLAPEFSVCATGNTQSSIISLIGENARPVQPLHGNHTGIACI